MKKFAVALFFFLSISGCAMMDVQKEQPVAPKNTKSIEVPNWPSVTYIAEDKSAFILLGIRDPKAFPIPREITFNSNDGKIVVKLNLVVPKEE